MAEKIKIAILGPGAVGGLLAAVLSKTGYDVYCIAKAEYLDVLNAKGISVRSAFFGNFVARPRFVSALNFAPDVLFITVKATALKESIGNISTEHVSNTLVIPLLNGFEHLDFLRQRFGTRVVAGTIGAIEVFQKELGSIEHLSQNAPSMTLTRHEGVVLVAEVLREAGISIKILDNERDVLWQKLLRLSALAAFTAVSRENIGVVRMSDIWRPLLEKFLTEVETVAHADGASVRKEVALAEIDALPAALRSSLQKDLAEGKESELDAIVGAILRRATRFGISCPTIEYLLKKIDTT